MMKTTWEHSIVFMIQYCEGERTCVDVRAHGKGNRLYRQLEA